MNQDINKRAGHRSRLRKKFLRMRTLNDPKLIKEIKKAEKEFERGEYTPWKEVKKELGLTESADLVVQDEPKKKCRTS